MVGAGSREQQRFRLRTPAGFVALQEEIAHGFGAAAPARLTRDEARDTAIFQSRGQCPHLRGLAGPLPALEADEAPAGGHAIPMSCLRPSQMRPKKPAWPTSSPAASATTCGGVSPV